MHNNPAIAGPAGRIEAVWLPAAEATPNRVQTVAVLCHPHPQYGGSMHDAVVDSTAQSLNAAGMDCVKFNFRGVGSSEGSFDNGRGEVEDLKAVINWVANEAGQRKIWVAGYSFGAYVTWQAESRGSEQQIAKTILIAPPAGVMSFNAHDTLAQTATRNLAIIVGDQDEFCPAAALAAWPKEVVNLIAGADHFFSGQQAALQTAVINIAKDR